jgi:hypothetical protein
MSENTTQVQQPIAPGLFITVAPIAVAAPSDADCVVHNLATGATYRLNDVGARVWEHLEAGSTIADIAAAIRAEYRLPEEITPEHVTDDIMKIVTDLHQYGLVTLGTTDQR